MTALNERRSLVHTYQTQQFAGTIEIDKQTNRKRLILLAEKYFKHQINKFPVGAKVSLYVTDKKAKRTEQQNRYYWMYITMIAEETRNEVDQLHELFKGEFLTEKIVTVLGKPVRIKKSTTQLSVTEFGDFIRNIEVMTKIESPPTDNYQLAPIR